MKVTVEVDCTPEEARRFLGLPDVVPMQQAIMEKLQQRMQSTVDATTPEALLKAWMPMAPDDMQQAFAKLFGTFGGLKPGDKGQHRNGRSPPSSTTSETCHACTDGGTRPSSFAVASPSPPCRRSAKL